METTNIISTNTASNNIMKELKNTGYDNFTRRPWNRFNHENTLWWLVPSKEWPSYKYGKIAILKEKGKEDFRIGLHVEKGLSSLAGQMLPTSVAEKLCIQSDWVWNNVLEDVKSGKFERDLMSISQTINRPLEIVIEASPWQDKDSNVEDVEDLELDHAISFNFSGGNLECIIEDTKGELSRYKHINSTLGLAEIFDAKDMEWFWIDLYILVDLENSEANIMEDIAFEFIRNYDQFFKDK